MLTRYNAIDIEAALRAATPPPPFPPATDRAAWERVWEYLGEERVRAIITQAEEDAKATIPALPATLFLQYRRTGQREGYETPQGVRRRMLASLTLAECLEHRGRFLDPLLDVAWAICEESSWSLPAHQTNLTTMTHHIIDLGVAMTALVLAEMDLLLGHELDAALAARIRWEVNERCFRPYLERHDHWWLYNSAGRTVNNWTAVCSGGVTAAALYLEPDPARLAEIIARAMRSLDDYLTTFDVDGGSSEGPGYWAYGFGYYTIVAQLVEHRTAGAVRLMDGEHLRKIGRFPLGTLLTRGLYVNFSDCDPGVSFERALLAHLSRRLDVPDLMRLAREQPQPTRVEDLTWALRQLCWEVSPQPEGALIPAQHDWYGGMMWMLARYDPAAPGALVLAAKGGHNGEMHNQNDVGNLIVTYRGESLIPDIGCGRYTKAYFGPDRYAHLATSSLGHSVPVPNGQAQAEGIQYAATLLEHRAGEAVDLLKIEMKGAYPDTADIESLVRTVALHREAPHGWVEVLDEVRFATQPQSFENILTTFATVEMGTGVVMLRGAKGSLAVRYDPQVVVARLDVVRDVDMSSGLVDVKRVAFGCREPVQQGVVRLRIEPL